MSLVSRRTFMAGAAGGLSLVAGGRRATAETKTLHVIGYTDIRDVIVKAWIAPFEKATGAKVQYYPSAGMELVGKLRAEQSKPVYSVMLADDWVVNYGRRFDLVQPLPRDKMPALVDVAPKLQLEDGNGVAILVNLTGLGYNTVIKPPASWADLWKPEFKRSILIPPSNFATSIMLLIIAASIKTGLPYEKVQYDLGPGFDYLKELKPNFLTIYANTSAALNLLVQGEAKLAAPFYGKNIFRHADGGAKINMTVPKEGGFASLNGAALVKNGPESDLGAQFINFGLTAEVQKVLAEGCIAGSVNRTVQLPASMADRAPINEEALGKLHSVDWNSINDRRSELLDRWNREIAS
jgi:putative spermidine/putrescine transport system substrate-binding protein